LRKFQSGKSDKAPEFTEDEVTQGFFATRNLLNSLNDEAILNHPHFNEFIKNNQEAINLYKESIVITYNSNPS
jgi:hypothetical protein